MPCSDGADDSHWLRREILEKQVKIDQLTRMLCRACRLLLKRGVDLPKILEDWYGLHQEVDRKRRERESREYQLQREEAKLQIQRLKKKFKL